MDWAASSINAQPVPRGDRQERLHRRHLAEQVDDHDAPGPRRDRGLDGGRGEILNVAGSMSTKTGVPPALWMAPAVAKKVKGVVMTSSPGLRSSALSGSSRASVPLAQPTACLVWDSAATAASSCATSAPMMKPWRSITAMIGREHLVLDVAILRDQIQQGYVHRSVHGKAPVHRPERPSHGRGQMRNPGSRVT